MYKMPMNKRKHAPKRRMVRRKRMGRRMVNVNRALQPIPQRYICKLKYADTVTTDAAGIFRFNLNSLFDPNRSGVGHQPYGYDTLATLYNRYRVISCGWRAQIPITASSGLSAGLGAMPANEDLSFANFSELRENPRAKYIVQNPGADAVVLRGKTYIPSLVGRNKSQYMADDRYQAPVNASPPELAVLNFYGAAGNDAPAAITFQVVLEYTVEFFDIKHLSQS